MLKNVQRLDQRNEAISDIEVQADLLIEETKSFAENAKKLKEQAKARNFKYTIFLVITSVAALGLLAFLIHTLTKTK